MLTTLVKLLEALEEVKTYQFSTPKIFKEVNPMTITHEPKLAPEEILVLLALLEKVITF